MPTDTRTAAVSAVVAAARSMAATGLIYGPARDQAFATLARTVADLDRTPPVVTLEPGDSVRLTVRGGGYPNHGIRVSCLQDDDDPEGKFLSVCLDNFQHIELAGHPASGRPGVTIYGPARLAVCDSR